MITKSIAMAGLVALLAAFVACGDGGDDAATTTSASAASTVLAPTPTTAAATTEAPATPTPAPTAAAPAPTPTPPPAPATPAASTPAYDEDRAIGALEGVTFVVAEGSEVTFTVEEQLTRLPLPIEAVMRTEEVSGEFQADGSPVVITIDLHSLTSDQDRRDQYVRQRMFSGHPTATFTVDGRSISVIGAPGRVEITLSEQRERRIALLRLPVVDVEIELSGFEPEALERFLAQFDRSFQRGGG